MTFEFVNGSKKDIRKVAWLLWHGLHYLKTELALGQTQWKFEEFYFFIIFKKIWYRAYNYDNNNKKLLMQKLENSGWQRLKIGFKGREREGRIELDQVKGREKRVNSNSLKSRQKCIKHNFLQNKFYSSFWYVLHDIDMAMIYYLHDYFI